MDRFDAGTQPSGRPPAPGRLGYVQAFCNSFWDLDAGAADAWADDAAYRRWTAARGLAGEDRPRAVAVREGLRGLFLAHNGHGSAPAARAALDELARPAPLLPRLATGTLEGDDAVGLALALVVLADADGSLVRMKACPHEHCGWVFHDASRNRSSQWCSMRLCGNRTKGARFRARQNGET